MTSLLITGSSGFVGSYFISNNTSFRIRQADLLTKKVPEIDFKGTDSVLHLAALAHQLKPVEIGQYISVNSDLSFDLASHAKAMGVKHFVFMSTVKVYGNSTTGTIPWDEFAACSPKDPYGISKLQAEKRLKKLEDDNFKVAIVRSPIVYGPNVKANMLNFIRLVDKLPMLPFASIQNRRSMVYLGNLMALLELIINRRAAGIFLASDPKPLSTTSIVELIAANLRKKIRLIKTTDIGISILQKVTPSIYERLWGSLEVNNSETNKILNFYPPFSTETGFTDMINWYLCDKSHRKNLK
ncbi:MAG: NAD-dependent epimerase/dehydratase family protein [Bacteroidales bacterium]|nr:NAD-dependent epimerase/dehydratase family protein [Bacteroidales bacterium]